MSTVLIHIGGSGEASQPTEGGPPVSTRHPTQAIIYVPHGAGGGEILRWLDVCVRHCTARGYGIAAIVHDDRGGERWADVVAMVADGVEVVVVARADHLPPARPGRIEVVADRHPPSGNGSRPRLRDAADRRPPPPSADR